MLVRLKLPCVYILCVTLFNYLEGIIGLVPPGRMHFLFRGTFLLMEYQSKSVYPTPICFVSKQVVFFW